MTSHFRFQPAVTSRLTSLLVLLPILFAVLLSGCGGGGDGSVIATVGDREITKEYFEDRLSVLNEVDLPRGVDGLPVDTGTYDGKAAFLQVIVNKELMALKAYDLGFGVDEQVAGTMSAVTEYAAGNLMHEELIKAPAMNVTEADIDDYYSKLGTQRDYHFMICNFRDDALKAREDLLGGALWDDVAGEYNDGSKGPNEDYTLRMQFGRVEDVFEEAMFNLEVGEISQPIETVYGYWLLRLDAVSDVRAPAMDDALREKIRNTLIARRENLSRTTFLKESRERHEFSLDETSLWIVYQGMPEREDILDPVTRQPVPKSELLPLDVPTADLDREFFTIRFDLDAEPEVWTIGDYKSAFDQMSVFQRPKRTELLGGVRKKILADMIDRQLLTAEARERGYFERSEVVGDARNRSEQTMITKLHEEVVTYEEQITPEEMQEFWETYGHEYVRNEVRTGKIVFALDQETAAAAHAEAASGASWKTVLEKYGANPENKEAGGVVEVNSNATGSLHDTVYAMTEVGTLSEPFPVQGGWAVVRLEKIDPSRQMEYTEAIDAMGTRIKGMRKNEALNSLLEQWSLEYGVEIDEDALAATASWEELKNAQ
jgi:parvulin-like peptidyl-prolyl isomerase